MRNLWVKLPHGRDLSRPRDCELSESHTADVVVIGGGGAGFRAEIWIRLGSLTGFAMRWNRVQFRTTFARDS
jgi:hypothetical protein